MIAPFEVRFEDGRFWLVEPMNCTCYGSSGNAEMRRPFDLQAAKAMFAALGHGLNELNPPVDPQHLG